MTENEKIIKDFLMQISTQNNRGTRFPYYYVIMDINKEGEEVERGMFLTETDAKKHLEHNHYHYSENAHTFIKHVWRAPELEAFFEALFSHFEVEMPR